MHAGYTTDQVARLLDLPAHRIRSYARAGFVTPARGDRSEYIFSFQDLVLLRMAAELARERVPPRRISDALTRLKSLLPDDRPLSELRIHMSGDEIVVREHDAPPWNPSSGQFHFEFDVSDFATRVAPLARSAAVGPDAAAGERSAAEWFERGLELETTAPDEARAAYRSALQLDASLSDARVNLGRLLQEAGLLVEAGAEYRRVLEDGEHALAAYNLGVVLEDQGRRMEAIKAYARAIATDPALAEAHFNLARLYEQTGDQRSAIRYFNGYRELMKKQPDGP